jgi:hypothetical protein
MGNNILPVSAASVAISWAIRSVRQATFSLTPKISLLSMRANTGKEVVQAMISFRPGEVAEA